MAYEFNKYILSFTNPVLCTRSPLLLGNVIIRKDVYIGPGAAIRGDRDAIIIEDGCNIQENCIIYMFPGTTVVLNESAHIGHGAIIHGAQIGRNVLVGMNAVLMDNVIVGENSIVGALAFVPQGMQIPERKVVIGSPSRVVKDVSNEMLEWKIEGTRLYQQLPAELYETLREYEPLREIPKGRLKYADIHRIWEKTKK